MIFAEEHKADNKKIADDFKEYLYHHMHHFAEDGKLSHELHHCQMYSKPSMQGSEFNIEHLVVGKSVYHYVVTSEPIDFNLLYDHADNEFKISLETFNQSRYYIIN